MRIAFYSDNFYPELSGITDTISTTGKELKKRGHEIIYVAPHYSPRDYAVAKRAVPATKADDTIDGMLIVRLPSWPMPISPTGQSRFAFPVGASFDAIEKFKPDIIHTQSPYGTGWEALRAAKKFNIPLIGTNHTDVADFYPFGMRSLMRHWDAFYYNHCAFVTTPYQKLIDRMREMGFEKPGMPLPNPADLDEFTPHSAEVRAEIKKKLSILGPMLIYAGRLGKEKKVDVLVRAVALLVKKFPTLTLFASGHGAARKDLDSLVAEFGIEKNVRFPGFLPRKTLVEAYAAADMFVMASTSDSQSLALMQGYASGLPAVCAAARGLPDYTPAACGVLAQPDNAADFAAKIESLLNDSEKLHRMGFAAVEYAQHFAPEKIATQWEAIYARAMQR